MNFLEVYQEFEELCRALFPVENPAKAYVRAMARAKDGADYVQGWENDLKLLQHYVYLHDQLEKEPQYSEENCMTGDALWLDSFCSRMSNRKDPLRLYRKANPQRVNSRLEGCFLFLVFTFGLIDLAALIGCILLQLL